METKKNTDIVHRWFEHVWNKRRKEAIDEMLHEDAAVHGLGEDDGGREGFRRFYDTFHNNFDDIHVDVVRTSAQDDLVAAHCHVKAKHRPTGKDVQFSGMTISRLEDGRIKESWNHFDFLQLLHQVRGGPANSLSQLLAG